MSETTPPPPPASQAGPPSAAPASSSKGLVGRVFDLSFSEFVTPSIIKVIFVMGIVGAALISLFVLFAFIAQGGGAIVVGVILAPIIFAFYVLIARVLAELYLILFKIEENTRGSDGR